MTDASVWVLAARRLIHRELGLSPAALPGGAGGPAVFPRRALCGLQLQRRTLGHLSAVYCLVFDPTGRYVITVSIPNYNNKFFIFI